MAKSARTFPYQFKRSEFGQIFNPLISLPAKASWGWQPLWFLVDSGADTTTLTIKLAAQLSIPVETKRRTWIYGIGERKIRAYPGSITLLIGHDEVTARAYFIDAEDSTLLLGRLDIFDRFDVCFESSNQHITFESLER